MQTWLAQSLNVGLRLSSCFYMLEVKCISLLKIFRFPYLHSISFLSTTFINTKLSSRHSLSDKTKRLLKTLELRLGSSQEFSSISTLTDSSERRIAHSFVYMT